MATRDIPSTATNRLTGSPYTYDENGNMTNDGLNTLAYDAESRVVRVNSSNPMYVYDGAGLRVKKCDPHCTSPTTTTVYVFSGSKVIAEYVNGAAVNSPTREYVYSGSQLIATHESTTLKFHHQDHLSRRVTTDAAGALVSQQGHFPFGEQWFSKDGSGNPVTPGKLFFTNYERDSESGNDFAIFRYYSNRNGRFCSADPMAGSTANPQSLNRYAYALNDPVNLIDPLGLEIECFQAFQVRVESDSETGEVLSVSVTPLGTFCFTGLVFPDYAPANDGKAPLDPKDSKEYEEQRRNALEKLNNKKCREFLTKALGAAGVEALKQAIQNQVPWNGSNSTISLADAQVIDPNNQTQAAMEYFANTSVAQHLRRRSGVGAVAQVGGPDVYFRSRNGFERLFGMAGSFRPRDVIHEALHASTGMADPGLVGLLDPTGKYKGEDSWRINVALMANNCK